MARARKFIDKQIAEVLRKAGGIQLCAARELERADAQAAMGTGRLPRTITRQAIALRVAANPDLRAICDEAREELLDLAEDKLRTGIAAGSESLIKFCLETIGKGRGYSRRYEHGGKDGGAIPIALFESDRDL